jgi:hypothetical protein
MSAMTHVLNTMRPYLHKSSSKAKDEGSLHQEAEERYLGRKYSNLDECIAEINSDAQLKEIAKALPDHHPHQVLEFGTIVEGTRIYYGVQGLSFYDWGGKLNGKKRFLLINERDLEKTVMYSHEITLSPDTLSYAIARYIAFNRFPNQKVA